MESINRPNLDIKTVATSDCSISVVVANNNEKIKISNSPSKIPVKSKRTSLEQSTSKEIDLTTIAEYWQLLNKINYFTPSEIEQIKLACQFAFDAHKTQKRDSGEPYICHPIAVACIVATWRMDVEAVIAALLHDTIEDNKAISKEQIRQIFGDVVADLVDGLTKLEKLSIPLPAHGLTGKTHELEESNHEYGKKSKSATQKEAERERNQLAQARNLHKMLMAMASDLRAIMIKLADRYHNLTTIAALPIEKRKRIAKESLEIYAPIANRLGLREFYSAIQDLAFSIIYPLRARVLTEAIDKARGKHRDTVTNIVSNIVDKLDKNNIVSQVSGREKSLYSVYSKMRNKQMQFSNVLDIYAFRIIVKTTNECYSALGHLHSLYRPQPGRFKDYIALPRSNGYQSLHTSLIGPSGMLLEVQIRTEEMEYVAQEGLAAHWRYKDDIVDKVDFSLKTHRWLQSLLDLADADASEFLENIKIDLFPDDVYVFTPQGKIIALPRGATVIDFAYSVHTGIGHSAQAAIIAQDRVQLNHQLRSGDIIEIITSASKHPNPSPTWLRFAKTGKAKNRIRNFLLNQRQEAAMALGERLLEQQFSSLGNEMLDISELDWQRAEKNSGVSQKQLLTDIGLGKRLAIVVAKLLLYPNQQQIDSCEHHPLIISGSEGMTVNLSHCCMPIPGDSISGIIRDGYGLDVHCLDCKVLQNSLVHNKHPQIELEWQPALGTLFHCKLIIDVLNERGILGRLSAIISHNGSNIDEVHTHKIDNAQQVQINLVLSVSNRKHLAQIIRQLRNTTFVHRIIRC